MQPQLYCVSLKPHVLQSQKLKIWAYFSDVAKASHSAHNLLPPLGILALLGLQGSLLAKNVGTGWQRERVCCDSSSKL